MLSPIPEQSAFTVTLCLPQFHTIWFLCSFLFLRAKNDEGKIDPALGMRAGLNVLCRAFPSPFFSPFCMVWSCLTFSQLAEESMRTGVCILHCFCTEEGCMVQLQLSPGRFGSGDGVFSGAENIPSVLQCLRAAVLAGSWVPWCRTVPSTLCQGPEACWHTVCKHSMPCNAKGVGGAH